jgi:aerobic-type carbon monoxide dehydrogenase small subunit (CoxS/CutS family)
MPKRIEIEVNGHRRQVEVDEQRSLLSVLRDDLDLTGSKYGCGEGQCGACTVIADGKAVRSCVTAAGSVAGKKIRTIEGLAENGRLHPVQEAFLEAQAMQCGYCTPGMIMSAVALVEGGSRVGREEIVRAMNGNMCRCGIYSRVVTAIEAAADRTARRSRR